MRIPVIRGARCDCSWRQGVQRDKCVLKDGVVFEVPRKKAKYPVVDVFAGPGGLGEGFASVDDGNGNSRFENIASIERDEFSHRTLRLRHFLRSFPGGEFPEEYYLYLKGKMSSDDLFQSHPKETGKADDSAMRISLGPDTRNKVKQLIGCKLGNRKKWALVGGPPCQAYSLVGRSRRAHDPDFESDDRHLLYKEYLKIIIDHRPPVFVMENVKGLLSSRIDGKLIVSRIVSDLRNPVAALDSKPDGLRYKLFSLAEDEIPECEVEPRQFLVKAEQYGVPQSRHRMFIVGIRSDIDVRPATLKKQQAPTVKETIGDLPKIRSGLTYGNDDPLSWRNEVARIARMNLQLPVCAKQASEIMCLIKECVTRNSFPEQRYSRKYPGRSRCKHEALRRMYDPDLPVLTSYETRGHMPPDLHRYMFAAAFSQVTKKSPKLSNFPVSLLPRHRNVQHGRAGTLFSDRFRVQLPDKPSTTITSHISKDGHYFIHYDPEQCRSLTVREAARLQTFPDNYKFEGPRTSQYHQVGNAVPPYLARQIASIISEVLDAMKGGL